MAWGWETANIGQSKPSWVLLGFGEWKADKASPHTLGGTRLEESQEDGTGGWGVGGGSIAPPPCAAGLCSFYKGRYYKHQQRVWDCPQINKTGEFQGTSVQPRPVFLWWVFGGDMFTTKNKCFDFSWIEKIAQELFSLKYPSVKHLRS